MLKRWIVSSLAAASQDSLRRYGEALDTSLVGIVVEFLGEFLKGKATCHEGSQGWRGRNWRKYAVKYDWGRKKIHCRIRLTKENFIAGVLFKFVPGHEAIVWSKAICIVVLYYLTISRCMKTMCSSGIRESEDKKFEAKFHWETKWIAK